MTRVAQLVAQRLAVAEIQVQTWPGAKLYEQIYQAQDVKLLMCKLKITCVN